jgi:hypothetical protein
MTRFAGLVGWNAQGIHDRKEITMARTRRPRIARQPKPHPVPRPSPAETMAGAVPARPGAAEIRRILGPLEDAQICRILEIGADEGDLQQAAAALAGDLPGHIGRPIAGPAAQIYDFMIAETYEEPDRAARGPSAEP